MKISFIIAMLAISSIAQASEKKFFVNGKEMSAAAATLASLKGEGEVYKCTQVAAKASKSGTISLKTKDTD